MPIQDAIGKNCNFCVGANLNDQENINQLVSNENELSISDHDGTSRNSNFSKHILIKKMFFWTCGIENMTRSRNKVTTSQSQAIDISIDETSYWKNFCDINAIIAIALSCFCFAFFNKYS